MKTMNLGESVKITLLIATLILVCILCAIGFRLASAGKSEINTATGQFSVMESNYSNLNVSLYDGSIIKGSEIVSLIRQVSKVDYLTLEVATLDGSTRAYNYRFNYETLLLSEEGADLEPPKDNSQLGYINEAANFLGATYEDENGNIVCLRFQQLR